VYVGVVDYSSFMQISPVVIANVDVSSSSFDDPRGDKAECTLFDAVDWHRWKVFAMNLFLWLKKQLRFPRGLRGGAELGLESSHRDETLLSTLPQDCSIPGEKHMASLRLAVRAIIGPIGM